MSKPLIPPNLSSRAITSDMAKGYKHVGALSLIIVGVIKCFCSANTCEACCKHETRACHEERYEAVIDRSDLGGHMSSLVQVLSNRPGEH